MIESRIRVAHVGPLVSVQDAGRFGSMRFGVPASGPMDRLAHAAANVALGKPAEAPALEVSLGGLTLECVAGAVTLAVAGGGFAVDHEGRRKPSWSVFTLDSGQRMSVKAGEWGSWAYIAFSGNLHASRWLGSAATHSLSGLGGGLLTSGQELRVTEARRAPSLEGAVPVPELAAALQRARVVMGPQERHFEATAITALSTATYTLSAAYDRMGVRLDGESLPLRSALTIPSEPVVRGSIQVAGDGVPTVLLADHQTTGGYPKIATVISNDLDQFAQLRPGQNVGFEPITPREAVAHARARHEDVADYLETLPNARSTLTHRLRGENLISGVVSASDKSGDGSER
ncbi:MAG: biotin-dependent carboxyltransferase family protein [Acidimicrobiia bacterium]|nr:biotin-dependent carboxyltransferase family protein [Acidimicrobiia bacterium]